MFFLGVFGVAAFFGQEKCLIDRNGRVRLPPRLVDDFREVDGLQVVLHRLPENALAIYPVSIWRKMRAGDVRPEVRAGRSLAYRRQLRRAGGFMQEDRLSNQGRITIPVLFRQSLELLPGTPVVLVGCEIGVEVWNAVAWQKECEAIMEYERARSEAEIRREIEGGANEARTDGASGAKNIRR